MAKVICVARQETARAGTENTMSLQKCRGCERGRQIAEELAEDKVIG